MTAATHDQKILEQAQKWVAQTFFGTLMKQMRESPFRSKLFEGGRGGEAFGALYDQRLVEHMARGAGHKLSEAIARKIEGHRAYGRKQPAAGAATQGSERNHVPAGLRA